MLRPLHTMRPLFAINLFAGLTFGLTLLYAVALSYGAMRNSRELEKLDLNTPLVQQVRRDVDDAFGGAVRGGCIAILQAPILVYAWKLKRKTNAA